jgi:two-component system C4-dicarboxylate transport sensor histidine kinase DctB
MNRLPALLRDGVRLPRWRLWAGLGLLVVLVAYALGLRLAQQSAAQASQRQLQVLGLDLKSILERYETLPYALSFHTQAVRVLLNKKALQPSSELNKLLQKIQQQAKVSAIYVMDTQGLTLASSNWDTEQSYVGKNFGFRPYFKDALAGGAGRFYGIGSTTAVPGYFIAQPIYAEGAARTTAAPIGVMAVKISLGDVATAWNRMSDPVALADRWGVIFLSNRPAWQYRSLSALSPQAEQDMAASLQYTGQHIAPVASLPAAARNDFGPAVPHAVGRLGWQLMIFPDQGLITRTALRWAATAALLLALAALWASASHQRRRRLEERGLAQQALQQAAVDLERQIEWRTAELTQANDSLARKYAALKATEALLRSTQDELIQAGKLTMLGHMAAGMTHELNQPLTAIRAFSDNARTFLERGRIDRAEENLGFISDASARMGAIIGQMKEFARKSDGPLAPVDLAQSIRSSVHLLQHDVQRSACELAVEVRQGAQVMGDAVRIEQVLINLLRNALDAVQEQAHKQVRVTLAAEDGFAVVRVTDSGAGIAPEVAQRLFEPFFTTKPAGKGLGLGLVISSAIAQAMNGRLTAHNGADGGAEFVLRLPLLNPDAALDRENPP